MKPQDTWKLPDTNLINKRALVKNSHKYVFKKLCENASTNDWCKSYLSVATTKLSDPLSKKKLPHSINKRNNNFSNEYTQMRGKYYHQKKYQKRTNFYDGDDFITYALKTKINLKSVGK